MEVNQLCGPTHDWLRHARRRRRDAYVHGSAWRCMLVRVRARKERQHAVHVGWTGTFPLAKLDELGVRARYFQTEKIEGRATGARIDYGAAA